MIVIRHLGVDQQGRDGKHIEAHRRYAALLGLEECRARPHEWIKYPMPGPE